MEAEPRTKEDLAGRRALVLGLARSGVALARMLTDAGARVTVYDRRPEAELGEAVRELAGRPVEFALGAPPETGERLVRDAELIFTSPSVSSRFPTTEEWLREALRRAEAGVPVISEVDLFLRLTRARTLGVTGTKGKTTTSALIGAILSVAGIPHVVGGNIGRPLVELVDELSERDWAVVELSELQLPTLSRGVDIAVYTNILADHLDRHGSVEAYQAVKAQLAELAAPGAHVVLNRDDPVSRALGERLPGSVALHWYTLDGAAGDPSVDAWLEGGWRLVHREAPVITVDLVPLPGRHMLANALAAITASALAGANPAEAFEGIRTFGGVPHRLETVRDVGGVRYVNDSQATIPAAAEAALRAFDSPIVLIAGGRAKGLDYAALADAAAECCRAAVLIGETAGDLAQAMGRRVPMLRAASMEEAVRRAAELAEPGDVVLLAPAAASFDMFVDYAARGDAFRAAVEALPGRESGDSDLEYAP